MKVLLLGAGAVGVYFGARLAQAGAEVTVVARGDYEVVSQRGYYEIDHIGEKFQFRPAKLLKDAADYRDEADYAIIASKVLPSINRAALLKKAVHSKSTVIVLIANGIDIEREIAAAFPDNLILSAIAYLGASRPEPGKVVNAGSGNLKIGRYPSGAGEEARRLAAAFAAAKVSCEVFDDIAPVRWNKLLWNLPFNPVSVLSGGADTAQICHSPELYRLCSELMDEVIATANACGVKLQRSDADHQLAYTRDFPAYKTSMLQDFLAGRALEVDAIVGNAVRLADAHRVPVPKMRAIYALLQMADAQNRATHEK